MEDESGKLYESTEGPIGGLLVEKFAPRRLAAGQRFEYRIRLTNVAEKTVSSAVLVESLLTALRIVETNPPSQIAEESSGRWTLGPIQPHEEVVVRIVCAARKAMWFRSYTSISYGTGT